MARGVDRRPLYLDNRDRDDFVRRVASLAAAGKVLIYAWALVPNELHLVVRTAVPPLARVMRSLLTGYAGVFNHRHGRHGHLFHNRYKRFQRLSKEFQGIQGYWSRLAKAKGILTDKDLERFLKE